jgi:uncharacterized paraquat-inducible protein A
MVGKELSATIAVEIVSVFAIMFLGIVIAVLWFSRSSSKIESKMELQKKKMEIFDKHFNEMIRVECPYCKTLYSSDKSECPNCGAETRKYARDLFTSFQIKHN